MPARERTNAGTTWGNWKMKRRTLDLIFASGGLVIALAMLVLGFVLMDQYNWGQDYVKEELGSQKIYFTAAD